ncbi:MAG: glycosyltransferase [Thermoanaerobaculia bacterium]|nr:glycosyltransferase [Thermoanaerobaculia bacterium]
MWLDVVIPTLDEEVQLALHLPGVLTVADRVVVSDGGSLDATRKVAAEHGVAFIEGPPGRGGQIVRGVESLLTDSPQFVEQAESNHVVLVLHADVRLPLDAREQIEGGLTHGAVGGGFRLEYDSPRRIYRLAEWLIHRRTRWTRCPLGDQAQFVRLDIWRQLGGMRPWPILEDLDLIRRLKRHGNVVLIDSPVRASARRFESMGIARTVAVDWLIWALYFLGITPERLARFYRRTTKTPRESG